MRFFIIIALFFTIGAAAFFVFGTYATNHFTGPVPSEQRFEVKPGENAMTLGTRLEQSGIVFSRYAFYWYLFHEEKMRDIVAGQYALSGSLTIPEIALLLTSGKTISTDIRVTFPEGWTFAQMSERLLAYNLPAEEFEVLAKQPLPAWRTKFAFLQTLPVQASLEGYLFPDTYHFAPDATAQEIILLMLGNFDRKLATVLAEPGGQVIDRTRLHAIVTMASIIEEEGRTEEERDMISGVFWKRIDIGQPLQSDATVNYVHGTSNLQPTFRDIEVDSPYNTYKYAGLPPGPISNPGLVSLRAALFPKANSYYYFLVNPATNVTVYSRTFEEHVQNRRANGL